MNQASASEPDNDRLSDVLVACLEAIDRGQVVDAQAWSARYPEFGPELAQFLANAEKFDRWAAPLRTAAEASLAPTPDPDATLVDESRPTPLPPLRSFGDYELLEEIAQGGMGIVFKAWQKSLKRLVALKMIRAGTLASAADTQRFRHEAETVAHLDHANIVPIYEVGEHAGQWFFSMKLIEGGNVARNLDRFAGDLEWACRLLMLAARAVHHAHERGVLHRDLKPSNILLDATGQPYVTDFGLAKRMELDLDLTLPGAIVGTPGYMAPEQAFGQRGELTPATDVYGLGVILFTLLTGRPPFRGATPFETLEQVREREPERPSRINHRVDRRLEAICLKCLEKEPERRYASAAALADDLGRWLDHEPISVQPEGWTARGRRFIRRRARWITISLAILFLPVLTLLLAYLNRDLSREEQEAKGQQQAQERIAQELAAGRPVELLGDSGSPASYRWSTLEPTAKIMQTNDGAFALQSWERGLLELVADPQQNCFRFRAEVRHDHSERQDGEVGIYCMYQQHPITGGLEHSYCLVAFNDLEPGKVVGVASGPRKNLVHQSIQGHREPDQLSSIHRFDTDRSLFEPALAVNAPGPWRRLALELTPQGIQILWEGSPINQTTWEEVRQPVMTARHFTPKLLDIIPSFDPRAALGLFVHKSSASFRRIFVEPLE
jgi:serine/threonine protein kinase